VRRLAFVRALALAGFSVSLAVPCLGRAQSPSTVPRIGLLGTDLPTRNAPRYEAFRQGLGDLGYVEGRNIAIEYRQAEGAPERLNDLAVELVGQKVDVIVAPTTPMALAAKAATGTIPIVFVTAADPVSSGLVASLARPGGNVTGLSLLGPELVARQLQLLKEAVPKASRVAVLSNPDAIYTALMLKETEVAARSLGVRVQLLGVRGADALDRAFSAIRNERPDALFVLFDPILFNHRARIADFANKHRLPAMYPHREYAESGGLMAYGVDLRDNFRRAAAYVDRILKGVKPADLPVEQPTKFELIVNLKTAKALGLTSPSFVLARVNEIIE
jgi:putative ABC transport system substrate-binding protein